MLLRNVDRSCAESRCLLPDEHPRLATNHLHHQGMLCHHVCTWFTRMSPCDRWMTRVWWATTRSKVNHSNYLCVNYCFCSVRFCDVLVMYWVRIACSMERRTWTCRGVSEAMASCRCVGNRSVTSSQRVHVQRVYVQRMYNLYSLIHFISSIIGYISMRY